MRAAFVTALVALLVAAPAADAAPRTLSGLHNARYCEILEIRGTPPDARVFVWNTIAHNRCPAEQWEALDAPQLATELGATAVILNGPRHFLMDSVRAEGGPVRDFHGLRMTQAATIPIKSAAELVQTPFTDRTIARSNTWTWKRGRTVFELVAPGGDVYVMQSYSQITDPSLSIRDLPRLGRRLDLPDGWRYRTRKLREELDLVARGRATVIQDELQNTYQLAKTTRPRGARKRRRVRLAGTTRTVDTPSAGTVEDRGRVTGTPFGRGSLALLGTFRESVLDATFRLTFADGSVTGTAALPFTISGSEIDFRGTARFTGGTGAYRGISASGLRVHDHNTLDGQNGTISVDGVAKW